MDRKIFTAALAAFSILLGVLPVAAQNSQEAKLNVESISPSLAGKDQAVEIIIAYDDQRVISRPNVRVNDVFSPEESLDMQVRSIGMNRWSATVSSGSRTTIYNVYISAQSPEGEGVSIGIEPVDEEPANRRDRVIDGFFTVNNEIDENAIFFESDVLLPPPNLNPRDGNLHAFSNPFPIIVDFGARAAGEPVHEAREYRGDSHDDVTLTLAELDGVDVLPTATTADGHKWRLLISSIESGEHVFVVNAQDEAGNTLPEDIQVSFRVLPRPAFPIDLVPGWNLISFPRALADSSIDAVFRPNVPVTTVFQFDPAVPGGWQGAVREQVADPLIFGPFVGDLRTIDFEHGYWVFSLSNIRMGVFLSDSPVGLFGRGAPVTPPVINLHEGWNLVPVFDITDDLGFGDVIDPDFYFGSLKDEISVILAFDALNNQWTAVFRDGIVETGTQEQLINAGTPGACTTCPLSPNERVEVGKAYWVFATEEGALAP